MRKTRVCEVPSLDVRALSREGYLEPGALGLVHWDVGGELLALSFDVDESAEDVAFEIEHGEERSSCGVELAWRPCRFGGARPLWLCPRCGERCALLFFPYAACRVCCELSYTSRSQSKLERSRARLRSAFSRVGVRFEDADEWSAPDLYFDCLCQRITRPKGRWQRTHERNIARLYETFALVEVAFHEEFGDILSQPDP